MQRILSTAIMSLLALITAFLSNAAACVGEMDVNGHLPIQGGALVDMRMNETQTPANHTSDDARISITNLVRSESTISFSWSGGSPPYAVQKTTSLSDSGWTTVGSAVRMEQTFSEEITQDRGFYRVLSSSAPTALSIEAGDASATLTWSTPTDSSIVVVNLYRGTAPGKLSFLTSLEATIGKFSDFPLRNETTYYYALTTVNTNGLESARTPEVSDTPVGIYDVYVDFSAGDDDNEGTSEYDAFATLKAATIAALAKGDGVSVGLRSESMWRESLDLSSLAGVTVGAYGEGNPPVVTGFDVQTNWTQDLTHTNLWYVDISHDTSGSNRPMALRNGALMHRRLSAASANSIEGSYYSDDAGSANPLRVYVHSTGNPNTSGHLYEVTTRSSAIFLGREATLQGVVARGAMRNNGPIEVGVGSTLRRCVAAYGTKHNILLASGTIEDCVMYESDAPSQTEPGQTMLVAFTPNATGLSVQLTRLLAYTERAVTSIVYAHTLNDPRDAYESISCDQCVGLLKGPGGGGIDGGPGFYSIKNSAIYGEITSAVSVGFSSTSVVSHFMGEQKSDIPNAGGSAAATWRQVAFARSGVLGGSQSVIKATQGSAVSLENVSLVTPPSYYGNAFGWVNDNAGSAAINRSLIVANNVLAVPSEAAYRASDHNVFVRTDIGPFATFKDVTYDLAVQMDAFRLATDRDAISVAMAKSPWAGNPVAGDFEIDSAAVIAAGHDGNVGVTEHWDYNLRKIVSGAPQKWPTIPKTYEEAVTYIQDPDAWKF